MDRRTLTLTRPKIPITNSNTILTGMISTVSLAAVRDSRPAFDAAAASEWDLILYGIFTTAHSSGGGLDAGRQSMRRRESKGRRAGSRIVGHEGRA